ncbi:NAD(P)/FAD-dependent oxidoreductase [Paracoccus sp. PAR01]|uniref:NAD(P)/FAD-dependent oxidoreductase n=1 Tax=Paracoccus sp. PAR01 TaxID=2769282 RepID=UPI00177F8D7D|nr:FAD-dependent oxidoreductase [Paracoccus sp. PAR01]MBD9527484.1 FAD-dependent oxidoreductase [Paracoccus sp. PAR01]
MNGMVIIGAGECGTRAAFALREQGYDGPVTLIGAEAGLPYERPPLSKPDGGQAIRKPICEQAALDAAGIDYRPGMSVEAIDRQTRTLTLTGGSLAYDRLLIATGARPRRLSCPGAKLALDFRTHADASAVLVAATGPVAIIGAGLIGMELAALLRGRGIKVTVIEAGPAPLSRAVPPHLATALHDRHIAEGVDFHFGQGIARIDPNGVTLASGDHVAAGLVISAIGVTPDTALAQTAGLATGNGILTDARLATSDPAIFAAGDCAAFAQPGGGHMRLESWRNARDQAQTAARNMLGGTEDFAALHWFWSDQYDLGLQVVGLPQSGQEMVTRPLGDGQISFYLADGLLVAAAGLGPGNSIARDIRLAEMLIAAGSRPDPKVLADPAVGLKALLKTARAA